ncbi:MAG TPA: adenosylcobinamide-GDP ribazoletransferase [Candidatus Limnocylindrales bacterium]|nr:adenosylcobinamide-GDP ribazoletransferase [Candidatus Limnocylindrales bacterium]
MGDIFLVKNYLCALSFLTVIPLPHVRISREGKELPASAVCFPLVGATLGLLLASAAWLLSKLLPSGPVVVLVLALSFLLTRGLHVDGLADTADGLLGTTSREKAFKAMDDSAVGVMGAATLLFVYLLKFTLLDVHGSHFMLPALFFMPLAGRWAIVNAGSWFGAARQQGLGDMFLNELRWPTLLKASLTAVVFLVIVYWWQPHLLFSVSLGSLLALVGAFLLALYASRRLGGLSGDVLGASSELGEALFLIGYYLVLPPGAAAGLNL